MGFLAVALITANGLRRDGVCSKLRAHATPADLITTTRHRTGRVNQLSVQSDDTPATRATEGYPISLFEVRRDQGVVDRLVERRRELIFLRLDEVKEARYDFGSLNPVHAMRGELLEDHEGRATNVLLAEVLDTSLRILDPVNNHVVQSATCSRYSDVEFIWNRAQATESPLGNTSAQRVPKTIGGLT